MTVKTAGAKEGRNGTCVHSDCCLRTIYGFLVRGRCTVPVGSEPVHIDSSVRDKFNDFSHVLMPLNLKLLTAQQRSR